MTRTGEDPWAWRALLRRELPLPVRRASVPPEEARGRVLADAVRSPEDLPARALSAMDGFAVRRSDLDPSAPVTLPVVADLAAAPGLPAPLPPGTAARIMTGAVVPTGADAVVPVERTDAAAAGPVPARVRLPAAAEVPPGRHVRPAGEEAARGALLAGPGTVVRAGLIGLAAELGIPELPVRAPARIVVVVTGDELTAGGDAAPGTVRESDGALLRAALAGPGTAVDLRRSGDDPDELLAVLARAAEEADLVVTTGGIGQGARDVVKLALGPAGTGTSQFTHLALRPGGPQGYGHLPSTAVPVVHLPGTPVGALVGALLFVRPLLPGPVPEPAPVRIRSDGAPERTPTAPGLLARAGRLLPGGTEARLLPGSRLAAYGSADVLVLLEEGREPQVLPL